MHNFTIVDFDTPGETKAEYHYQYVGRVDHDDGHDEYYLVSRLDDTMVPEEAREHFLKQVYHDCGDTPGAYYCTSVGMMVSEYHDDNQVMLFARHRYNV